MPRISLPEARRMALAAHGLHQASPFGAGKTAV